MPTHEIQANLAASGRAPILGSAWARPSISTRGPGGSLEDYERQSELALDRRYGIYSLPYTIVGQAQLIELPALPADHAAAMRTLAEWKPAFPLRFNGPPQAESYRSPEEWRAIIRNSGIEDPEGRWSIGRGPIGGQPCPFPQDPNPALFRDSDQATIANTP